MVIENLVQALEGELTFTLVLPKVLGTQMA